MSPPDPLLLSLDTTAAHCAAALLSGDTILATRSEPMLKGQAERLLELVDEVLDACGKTYADLDAIAVATGPGNFTGVRICVSAARGLALALGVPAVGVSVFDAMVYGADGHGVATIDARGGKIFAQTYANGTLTGDAALIPREDVTPADDRTILGFCAPHRVPLPAPEVYGKVAMARGLTGHSRPSPLYIRAADAALPADPPPRIVP